MKIEFFVALLLMQSSEDASAVSVHFIPRTSFFCGFGMDLAFETVFNYFKDQHSLTIIDSTDNRVASTSMCSNGNFLPFLVFDEWKKVNLGAKISDSALSPYPTTRGFYIKYPVAVVLNLYPNIAEFNPRAKLLIQLEKISYVDARLLLEVGYHKYKMLDVAVIMYVMTFDKGELAGLIVSICLYNPFAGDSMYRQPEFKCFNITTHQSQQEEIEKFIHLRVTNLNQFPLRIDIFDEWLMSLAVRNEKGIVTHYKYEDGETVAVLAKKMNFKPFYVPVQDKTMYGYRLSNGTFTGSIGAIEHGRADFSAKPKLISDYGSKKSLLLEPINVKKLFFITRKNNLPRVFTITIFYHFDKISKFIAIFFTAVFPLIYVLINKYESDCLGVGKAHSIGRNTLYTYGLMNNISAKHSTLAASRVVVATVLFYSIMISSLFQGTLIKNLNQNDNDRGVETIDELFEQNYFLITTSPLAGILRQQGGSEIGEKMKLIAKNPAHIVDYSEEGFKMTLTGDKVAFLLANVMKFPLIQFYDPVSGENLYELVPEILFEFYIAPMTSKDSPFIETFNYWLMHYREVGIQKYQAELTMNELNNVMIYRVKHGMVPKKYDKRIRLRELVSIFFLYFILNAFCFSTFIVELLYNYFRKKCTKIKKEDLRTQHIFLEFRF